jgi:3-oxoacyl-[acyl-carrier protein] reductase
MSSVVAEFGGLDILGSNAGIFEVGSLDKTSLEDIERNLALNVKAVVLASRAVLPHLGPASRIISIGSCLATRVSGAGIARYALTKAALIGLTKGLACDLGSNGTTVISCIEGRQTLT